MSDLPCAEEQVLAASGDCWEVLPGFEVRPGIRMVWLQPWREVGKILGPGLVGMCWRTVYTGASRRHPFTSPRPVPTAHLPMFSWFFWSRIMFRRLKAGRAPSNVLVWRPKTQPLLFFGEDGIQPRGILALKPCGIAGASLWQPWGRLG